jgi:hypothetical protein
LTTAETPLNLHITLASGWAEIASLLAADVVRFDHTLECHPLRTQDQVFSLIHQTSWDVFIGIWPDQIAARTASIAITRQAAVELHASELVYCGAGAALIAIRPRSSSMQAQAERLAGSLSGILRQLALQLAFREMGSQTAPALAPADTDPAHVEHLVRELNDQLTILVNCAQSLVNLVGSSASARGFAADLLEAAANIAETSKQFVRLAGSG